MSEPIALNPRNASQTARLDEITLIEIEDMQLPFARQNVEP